MKKYVLLIILMALCLMIYTVLRRFRKTAVCIGIVCVVLIGLFGTYLFNNEFKHIVNMNYFPLKQHTYIIENQMHSVPLPPKTALMYRTSDKEAVYVTKLQAEQVTEFFLNAADRETFFEYKEKDEIKLSFSINGEHIFVVVDNGDKNVKFTVTYDDAK